MNEPAGPARPDTTAWLTIVDWPGETLEIFDELDATHDDQEHVGLRARYGCQQPDAPRIVAACPAERRIASCY